jgi:hypothetical protein
MVVVVVVVGGGCKYDKFESRTRAISLQLYTYWTLHNSIESTWATACASF